MAYQTGFRDGFLESLLSIQQGIAKKVSNVDAELRDEPCQGPHIKKLKGFDTLYRYRIGDHRLIYSVQKTFVELLFIGPRASVYERLRYDPDAPDETECQQVEALLYSDSSAAKRQKVTDYWLDYGKRQQTAGSSRNQRLPQTVRVGDLKTWGIEAVYHAALQKCKTEDDLLAAEVPSEVLSRVIDALYPSRIEGLASQPTRIIAQSEDLDLYLQGELSEFLLKLDKDQEKLIEWSLQGPVLVKGGPGSGKSTLALYRTAALVRFGREHWQKASRVLFTTYTKTLVTVSEQLLDRLLDGDRSGVEVRTLDAVALEVADAAGLERRGRRPTDEDWEQALDWARQQEEAGASEFGRIAVIRQLRALSNDFLKAEFSQVIEGRGLSTQSEYLEAERAGRRTGLRQSQRVIIYHLYKYTKQWLHGNDFLTYGDIRLLALRALTNSPGLSRYSAVVVDEAQDLSPVALQLARALAKWPKYLYLTADLSQSIYNRGFSLASALPGTDITRRTRILHNNYRSTAEIMAGATRLLSDAGEPNAQAGRCRKNGPKPVIIRLPDNQMVTHAEVIAEFIRRECRNIRVPYTGAAVLCRTGKDGKYLARVLEENHGLKAVFIKRDEISLDQGGVKVMTMHSAKGLEFPIVALPRINCREFAPCNELDDDALNEHWDLQRRLVYMAATRAMRRLLVTTTDELMEASPFFYDVDEATWVIEIR